MINVVKIIKPYSLLINRIITNLEKVNPKWPNILSFQNHVLQTKTKAKVYRQRASAQPSQTLIENLNKLDLLNHLNGNKDVSSSQLVVESI